MILAEAGSQAVAEVDIQARQHLNLVQELVQKLGLGL